MQSARRTTPAALLGSLLILGLAASLVGCTIDSHKQGDSDNVKIATPFGGMSVKTNDNAVAGSTGLPTYPGAQIDRKLDKENHDNGAADINMSFGSFQLRVKAISYRTADSPDKVLAFYRKGLTRFGTVIQCSNHQPVGTLTVTPEGLDCSEDGNGNKAKFKANTDFTGKFELKAGSRQHQHIVAINPDGSGTKFGLVALDLPTHLSFGDNNSDSGDNQRKPE